MSEKLQPVKDVVSLAVSVAELVDSAMDGVVVGDLFQVLGVLKKIQPAVAAVKSGNLLDVYKSLSEGEQQELSTWFNSELDITNNDVEAAIEQAWVVVLGLGELVKLIKP